MSGRQPSDRSRGGAGRGGARRRDGRPGSELASESRVGTGRRRAGRPESELGGEQVEGRQAVRELLAAGRRSVREVWLADGVEQSGPVADIVALANGQRVPLRLVPRARVDAKAGTDAPQGVIAFAEPLAVTALSDLVGPDSHGVQPFLVVLDGVTDPHNVGAVLRSAVGAGATGAVIPRHRAARLGPTALKAAAGAVEHLPIALVAGIPGALTDLKQAGVWTVGLDGDGPGELWDLGVATEPVALILGAEGRGISRLVRDRCDLVVRIPMPGPLPSLNVAAAGALACFEVARRRAASPPH